MSMINQYSILLSSNLPKLPISISFNHNNQNTYKKKPQSLNTQITMEPQKFNRLASDNIHPISNEAGNFAKHLRSAQTPKNIMQLSTQTRMNSKNTESVGLVDQKLKKRFRDHQVPSEITPSIEPSQANQPTQNKKTPILAEQVYVKEEQDVSLIFPQNMNFSEGEMNYQVNAQSKRQDFPKEMLKEQIQESPLQYIDQFHQIRLQKESSNLAEQVNDELSERRIIQSQEKLVQAIYREGYKKQQPDQQNRYAEKFEKLFTQSQHQQNEIQKRQRVSTLKKTRVKKGEDSDQSWNKYQALQANKKQKKQIRQSRKSGNSKGSSIEFCEHTSSTRSVRGFCQKCYNHYSYIRRSTFQREGRVLEPQQYYKIYKLGKANQVQSIKEKIFKQAQKVEQRVSRSEDHVFQNQNPQIVNCPHKNYYYGSQGLCRKCYLKFNYLRRKQYTKGKQFTLQDFLQNRDSYTNRSINRQKFVIPKGQQIDISKIELKPYLLVTDPEQNKGKEYVCGHTQIKYYARGLCKICYHSICKRNQYRDSKKEKKPIATKNIQKPSDMLLEEQQRLAKQVYKISLEDLESDKDDAKKDTHKTKKIHKEKPNQKKTTQAKQSQCGHPDRKHAGRGFCVKCYSYLKANLTGSQKWPQASEIRSLNEQNRLNKETLALLIKGQIFELL